MIFGGHHPFCFGKTYRAEDFFGLLQNSDFRPFKHLKDTYTGGVMNSGRGMGTKQGGKPLAVGQGRRRSAIADSDQIPHLGRFRHRSTDRRASSQKQDFLGLGVQQVVENGSPLSRVALFSNSNPMSNGIQTLIIRHLPHCHPNATLRCNPVGCPIER